MECCKVSNDTGADFESIGIAVVGLTALELIVNCYKSSHDTGAGLRVANEIGEMVFILSQHI